MDETLEELEAIIDEASANGGNILIPSFAVGRTQELVYAFHQLCDAQKIPDIEIYVDSPLAINVTEVYSAHPECYDREMLDTMATDSDGDPDSDGVQRLF